MSSQQPFLIALLSAAYLLGNLSPGLLLTRLAGHGDLRDQGSGATGATNAGRLLGKKGFAAVLALDTAKGALATLLPVLAAIFAPELSGLAPNGASVPLAINAATTNTPETLAQAPIRLLCISLACGLSAIAGHVWPALLGFRGGKGIGPFFGVCLAAAAVAWPTFWFAPLTLLPAIAYGLLMGKLLHRRASLYALSVLPSQALCLCLLIGSWKPLPPALAMTLILIYAHRENFRNSHKQP